MRENESIALKKSEKIAVIATDNVIAGTEYDASSIENAEGIESLTAAKRQRTNDNTPSPNAAPFGAQVWG